MDLWIEVLNALILLHYSGTKRERPLTFSRFLLWCLTRTVYGRCRWALKERLKIPKGHSNSQVENKLTTSLQTTIHKHNIKNKRLINTKATKHSGDIKCYENVRISCSRCGTLRVADVITTPELRVVIWTFTAVYEKRLYCRLLRNIQLLSSSDRKCVQTGQYWHYIAYMSCMGKMSSCMQQVSLKARHVYANQVLATTLLRFIFLNI